MYFSTKDRDNDQWSAGTHCAQFLKEHGGIITVMLINPNGVHDSSADTHSRVSSYTTGSWVYYPNFEMKIRPKSCALTQTSDTCA